MGADHEAALELSHMLTGYIYIYIPYVVVRCGVMIMPQNIALPSFPTVETSAGLCFCLTHYPHFQVHNQCIINNIQQQIIYGAPSCKSLEHLQCHKDTLILSHIHYKYVHYW